MRRMNVCSMPRKVNFIIQLLISNLSIGLSTELCT